MATVKEATSKTDMITVEGLIKVKKQNIISTFSDNKKIEPMIEKVRKEVSVEKFDLSTKKGRDDIASRAYKVSKMKNAVVKQLIDPSVEEYKAAIKGVGAGKSHWNSEMDALRDEIRAPLNKWEEEEKVREQKRVDDIKKSISGIINLAILPQGKEYDKNYISEMIEAVDNIDCSEGFEEFAQEALQAKASSKEALSQCLNTVIQKELEAAQQLKLAEQQEELDEAQRVMEAKAKAQERLNKLIMIPSTMFGKTSVELNKKLNSIELVEILEILESEFGELFDQANLAKNQVIVQLGQMAEQQAKVEKAEAQETAQTDHEEQLQEQRPEFCGREFTNNEPLQELPTANKEPECSGICETENKCDAPVCNKTKTFKVRVEWSGYSRGYSVYEVEADSKEEALENYYEGNQIEREVVRDDTEAQEKNIIN